MGCGCISAGLHACTTAPITDRRQLKLIPEEKKPRKINIGSKAPKLTKSAA